MNARNRASSFRYYSLQEMLFHALGAATQAACFDQCLALARGESFKVTAAGQSNKTESK